MVSHSRQHLPIRHSPPSIRIPSAEPWSNRVKPFHRSSIPTAAHTFPSPRVRQPPRSSSGKRSSSHHPWVADAGRCALGMPSPPSCSWPRAARLPRSRTSCPLLIGSLWKRRSPPPPRRPTRNTRSTRQRATPSNSRRPRSGPPAGAWCLVPGACLLWITPQTFGNPVSPEE